MNAKSAALLLLLATSCAAKRYDQQLPSIQKPAGDPITIQIEPGDFPNDALIVPGLFPEVMSGDVPLERLDGVIEEGFRNSGAFEVLQQQPGQGATDARYLLEFELVAMENEESGMGEALSIMEVEKNEYCKVVISYRLYNNGDGSAIGGEKQIEDHYKVKYSEYSILNKLGLRASFEKVEKEHRPYAQATIRAIVKLVADVQDRINEYEAARGSADVDRG